MIVKTYRTTTNTLIPISLYRQLRKTRREIKKTIILGVDFTTDQLTNLYVALNQIDELIPALEGRRDAHNG
jgi:hypothetical protein